MRVGTSFCGLLVLVGGIGMGYVRLSAWPVASLQQYGGCRKFVDEMFKGTRDALVNLTLRDLRPRTELRAKALNLYKQ